MFTGPVGPVEVFFYWPETVFGNFYWPGAIGSPLASSPVVAEKKKNIASLKHATYKIEEKSISTITNMKRGKNNHFAFLE